MIVLLVVAWAIVLVPSVGLRRMSPVDGVRSFERFMGILASTRSGPVPGRWIMVPRPTTGPRRRRFRVIRRRRQAFQRLLIAAGVTLLVGLLPHMRALLIAHLGMDVALAAYVVRLRRWRLQEVDRKRIVHHIRSEPVGEELAAQSG